LIYGIFLDDRLCVYIGKVFGQDNVGSRRRQHLHSLRHGKHHSSKLQEYFDDGKSLSFEIIKFYERISDDDLYLLEVEYVKKYNTYNSVFGCNSTIGGKGVKGLPASQETISKISKTKLEGFENGQYIKTDGEINGMHILKEDQIKDIVKMFYQDISHQRIADLYGVCRQAISHISTGNRWSYLPELQEWLLYKNQNRNKLGKKGQKLRDIDVYEIKYLLKNDAMTQREMALIYEVSEATIGNIKRDMLYKHVSLSNTYSYHK
jgi:DNA-binding XRE family transcriptional regulator